jgi:hypothetical protein
MSAPKPDQGGLPRGNSASQEFSSTQQAASSKQQAASSKQQAASSSTCILQSFF